MQASMKFLQENLKYIENFIILKEREHYILFYYGDNPDKINYDSYYKNGGNIITAPVYMKKRDLFAIKESFNEQN